MTSEELRRAVEAVLLVAVEPVPAGLLAELPRGAGRPGGGHLRRAGRRLPDAERRGFVLARVAGGYRYQTHPDLAPYVERFANREVSHRLSTAALETLAIVAYRQPVSRAQISALRGVNVDGVVRLLEQRGYIEAVGRAEGPGQPVLTAPPICSWSGSASTASTSCPRWRTSCPGPRWWGSSRSASGPRAARWTTTTEGGPGGAGDGVRLQKVLARAGLGSRRACDELIAAGRVAVDGRRAMLGQRVDPLERQGDRRRRPAAGGPGPGPLPAQQAGRGGDHGVGPPGTPDGRRAGARPSRGSSRSGRLDIDTEGLLVLTNDGDLAQLLAHPSHGVAKEYLAEVRGAPSAGALRALRAGVDLDGVPTAPARVGVVAPGVLRIVIHEGRNRQVRRMCEAVGHPVTPAGPDPHRPAHRPRPRAGAVAVPR